VGAPSVGPNGTQVHGICFPASGVSEPTAVLIRSRNKTTVPNFGLNAWPGMYPHGGGNPMGLYRGSGEPRNYWVLPNPSI
jgi:hypothetical protein